MCKICNYFCAVDCLILLLLIVNLYIYNLYFSTFHSIAIMLLCSLKLVFYSHLANLIDFFLAQVWVGCSKRVPIFISSILNDGFCLHRNE